MTQKDKIHKAALFAVSMKQTAKALRAECKSYDETWALRYATDITERCDKLIKDLKL